MDIKIIKGSDENIVDINGRYDLENFSEGECNVIIDVIKCVKEKYPDSVISLGFANECSAILYKPRYVLWEMIIQLYKDSDNPIDKMACAFAYESQGASKREMAISKFEESQDFISPDFLNNFIYLSPLSTYMKFSRLYESEHEYDKAIYYTELGSKYGDPDNSNFRKRIDELKAKKAKNSKKRVRKRSQSDIEFEEKVKNAALFFINNFWN